MKSLVVKNFKKTVSLFCVLSLFANFAFAGSNKASIEDNQEKFGKMNKDLALESYNFGQELKRELNKDSIEKHNGQKYVFWGAGASVAGLGLLTLAGKVLKCKNLTATAGGLTLGALFLTMFLPAFLPSSGYDENSAPHQKKVLKFVDSDGRERRFLLRVVYGSNGYTKKAILDVSDADSYFSCIDRFKNDPENMHIAEYRCLNNSRIPLSEIPESFLESAELFDFLN